MFIISQIKNFIYLKNLNSSKFVRKNVAELITKTKCIIT